VVSSDVRKIRIASKFLLPPDLVESLARGVDDVSLDTHTSSLLTKLNDLQIVVEETSPPHKDETRLDAYFSHIGLDHALCRKALSAATVAVVGLGGMGSVALQHLVTAGIRNFVLIDRDRVDASNLERQFIYSQNDIGKQKIHAAAEYISRLRPEAQVQAHNNSIFTNADVQNVCNLSAHSNICLICIDQPFEIAVRLLPRALWERNIVSIQGGVMCQSGFFGPVRDPSRSKLFALEDWPTPHAIDLADPVGVCFPPNNTVVASLLVSQALHHIIGANHLVEYEQRVFIDLFKWKFVHLSN